MVCTKNIIDMFSLLYHNKLVYQFVFTWIYSFFQLHNQPSSLPGSPYRTAVVSSGNISEGSGDRPTISDNKETYSSGPMTPGSLQRVSSQGIQRRK